MRFAKTWLYPGRRLIEWLLLAAAFASLGSVLAYSLYEEHQRSASIERERLATQAKVVSENLARHLNSINHALAEVRSELPAWRERADGRQLASSHLKALTDAMPAVRTMTILDANGIVVNSSRSELIGNTFGTRDYFRIPQHNPDPNTLYVGSPIRTSLGIFSMILARAIVAPDGRFVGIVAATLDPEEFRILLSSVLYAPDMISSLMHGDGTLFVAMPSKANAMGLNMNQPGSFFSRHLQSGKGANVFTGATAAYGSGRMGALLTIQPAALVMDRPLVVAVGRDIGAIFAPWQRDVVMDGGLFGLFALAAVSSMAVYQKRRAVREGDAAAVEREREERTHRMEQLLTVQKAMLENEVLLRSIIQALDEGVLLLDGNGIVVVANPAAAALLGRSRQELLGMRCPQLIQSADDASGQSLLCAAQASGLPFYSREVVFHRGDGTSVPVSVRATPTHGADGGLVVAFYDISAEKSAEEKRVASERRLHILIDATPGSAMLLDLDGRIEVINSIGARRLASTPEELVGCDFFARLPAAVSARRRAVFAGVCASGEAARTTDQRGQYIFQTDLFPAADAKGEIQQIAIYSQDVTQSRRAESVQALFHEIGTMLLRRDISLDTLMWHVCRDLAAIFDFAFVWIARKRADGRIEVAAGVDSSGSYLSALRELPLRWDDVSSDPVCGVVRQGKLHVAETAPVASRRWQSLASEEGAGHIICLPLTLEGGTYGVLTLGAKDTLVADAATLKHLDDIGNRLSFAMEAAIQQERLSLMETALESSGNAVFITDAVGTILWANSSFGRMTGFAPDEAVGRKPSILKSGAQDSAFYAATWRTILAGIIWRGELIEARRDGSRFTAHQTITPLRDPEGRISHFVSILEDISEQKAARDRIEHLANFDALTDLPNRSLFFDRLSRALVQARRAGESCALLFLDLDRFKQVNDSRGHEAGDQLLKAVADRLRGVVRESDTVARLAGDEFTVILAAVGGRADCARVAEKVIAAVGRPYVLAASEESIGVSVGIALFPNDAADSEGLVAAADKAMYAAKVAGRGTFRFHGDEGKPATCGLA
ncbi:MAG: diguanylate cyclase [Rhodocyclaceae bacterium]|nr:diguanylate cyclase [Rhodocyclaceae bacterium]